MIPLRSIVSMPKNKKERDHSLSFQLIGGGKNEQA